MQVRITEKELSAGTTGTGAQRLRTPSLSMSVKIPWWAKFALRIVARPLLDIVFTFLHQAIGSIVNWILRIAEKYSGRPLPSGVEDDIREELRKWLEDIKREILSQI